jgi:transcriptional regulator GlxA family with amidase domain
VKRVAFLIVDGAVLFDLAGPAQAFHEAARLGAEYRVCFVSPHAQARSELPLGLAGLDPLPLDLGASDIVVVPGSTAFPMLSAQRDARREPLAAWLRAAYDRGATIASVCVGAFLLGAAGLLNERTCTTHWKRVQELQRRFPRARVRDDRLYVFDGRVATSAGIASGVDLALAMLERDAGPHVCAAVAREMVVTMRRSGAQHQLSPYFAGRDHAFGGVHAVQDALATHPERHPTLKALAAEAGVSSRTLTRQFKAATGATIKQYATAIRLEHARALLRDRSLTIESVAERCGFSDPRQFRRLWKRAFGEPPSASER